jgi:hypothetical protein
VSKVLILVEGQTEETFVRDLLAPHLSAIGVYPIAKLATTKRVKSGPDFKGGIVSYGKLRGDVIRLLGDTSAVLVTTMIDFYRLPQDSPGRMSMPPGSCHDKVVYVEQEIGKDINHRRFLPYLALHEFEAMLFVDPARIDGAFPEADKNDDLAAIKRQFKSPEEIDDDPATAPSRRIKDLFPGYRKPLYGPLIALEIGIEQIRKECSHFSSWLKRLENLGGGDAPDS